MRRTAAIAMSALLAASVAWAGGQMAKIGSTAPEFTATGADGKTHTLKTLSADGDLYLYFIKEDCPVNAEAVKYYNQLGKGFKDKATMVGVFNGTAAQFKTWDARHKSTYPVLLDPDMKIIESYKATASPWMIRVSEGKIAKVWPGYSVKDLNDMNATMAASAKAPKVALDLKGAPADTAFG